MNMEPFVSWGHHWGRQEAAWSYCGDCFEPVIKVEDTWWRHEFEEPSGHIARPYFIIKEVPW